MKTSTLCLAAVLCASLLYLSAAAVIGVDFGSQYFKVSMIQPGKTFTIVENKVAKRKSPTAISYIKNERLYESDAESKKSRYPSNTFLFVNKYLGALESDTQLFETSREYFEDFVFSFDPEKKTVRFNLTDFQYEEDTLNDGEKQQDFLTLSVEDVTAQILRYAKKISDIQSNSDVRDAVITIPAHWGISQRNALKNAAEIAGLTVLGFVHENTAAAVWYGIDRIDENKTHTVLFYNMGSENIQTSIIQYQAFNYTKKKPVETLTVLSDYGITGFGGRKLDLILAHMIAEDFDSQPKRKGKPSIKENKRAMLKLQQQATKVKEQLSANKEIPVYIENLVDGLDYRGHFQRAQFEERAAGLFSQLTAPIDRVLGSANLTLADIDAIELLGGGVRVPKIQEILKQYMGSKEVGQHLNGDEAMALGASFLAANYSPSFRVRDIRLNDGFNFEVQLVLKSVNPSITPEDPLYYYKNVTLFNQKKRFGSLKSIVFKHFPVNLQIELYLVADNGPELFSVHRLDQIEALKNDTHFLQNETAKPKYHLEFALSSVDIVKLTEAYLEFNYTETILPTKKQPNSQKSYQKMWEEYRKKMEEYDSANNGTNFNQTFNFSDFNFNYSDSAANESESQQSGQQEEQEDQQQGQQDQQQDQQQGQQKGSDGEGEAQKEPEANSDSQSSEAGEDEESQQQKTESESAEGQKDDSSETDSQSGQADAQSGETPQNNTESQFANETASNETSDLSNKTSKRANRTKSEQQPKQKLRVKKVAQNFTNEIRGIVDYGKVQFRKSKELIRSLDNTERKIKNLAEIKNQFESFLYEIKTYPNEEIFMNATTEQERNDIYQLRDQYDEWFESEEAFTANYSVYKKKINALNGKLTPIKKRVDEYIARPRAYNKSMQVMGEYYDKFTRLNRTMPWLTEEQKATFLEKFNETYTWIYAKFVEQDDKPLNEDPIFLVDDVKPKLELIKREYTKLKGIKKPKNETTSTNSTSNSTDYTSNSTDGETQSDNSESKQKKPEQESNESNKSKKSKDKNKGKKQKNQEKESDKKQNKDQKKREQKSEEQTGDL